MARATLGPSTDFGRTDTSDFCIIAKELARPDNCDGTYQEYCDDSREYSNITSILEAQNRTELLSYMKEYWPDYEGADEDESFWEHEWNKHGMSDQSDCRNWHIDFLGTCINTIDPSCYTDYYAQEEVGDFFQQVVDLFKTLDSYTVCKQLPVFYRDTDSSRLSPTPELLPPRMPPTS